MVTVRDSLLKTGSYNPVCPPPFGPPVFTSQVLGFHVRYESGLECASVQGNQVHMYAREGMKLKSRTFLNNSTPNSLRKGFSINPRD